MVNEFNPAKMKEELAARLVKSYGMEKQEAEEMAGKEVESMGATKTLTGQCPQGGTSPMACMFCHFGHMTNCHYPYTCEEAKCGHYMAEKE